MVRMGLYPAFVRRAAQSALLAAFGWPCVETPRNDVFSTVPLRTQGFLRRSCKGISLTSLSCPLGISNQNRGGHILVPGLALALW